MGAIAVFLSVSADDPSVVIGRMTAASPHRGTSIRKVVHGRCAMACNTHEGGADAVVGVAFGLAVAFMGSLDNADDLARELAEGPDGTLGTAANGLDLPSLLARAFRAHRWDLPSRLRGVFAGAISDGEWVYCFRDHIGYRPLFYRRDARGFLAATEAKQVVAGAGISREPDLEVVDKIFYRDVDDNTPAALVGVRRLPKSTAVSSDGRSLRERRYWYPETLLETQTYAPDELRDRFTALMDQAVSRCLTGRDAISLSGGIDSPAVAAFAAPRHLEMAGRPLHALSVVYPRYPSVDESRYVTMLARHFRIPLHAYEMTANAVRDLSRWVALADSPFPGAALAQYEENYLEARKLGIGTVLTGEHAEFVFGMQWYTLEHYLTHGRFSAARKEILARRARGRSWVSLARLIVRSVMPDRVMAARNAFTRQPLMIPRWVDRRRASAGESVSVSERWRRSQLVGFIGPGISLEAEEVCQEVCGVRSRKPWTDVDLWEFFLSLRAEQKFPDLRAKGLVRDLLRGRVPDEILDRQDKTVFDEALMAEIDYPTLRGFLIEPKHRIEGVNYGTLADLLRREHLTPVDYRWARNLANVQAFLSQW